MLGSLPMFMPRDVYHPWQNQPRQSSGVYNTSATLNPPHAQIATHQPHQQPHNQQARRRNHHSNASHDPNDPYHCRPTRLQFLKADEELYSRRKENIRKFGAGWLKPPGIPKTLQASLDEAAERQEQEALARREESAREMREVQERMEREQRMEELADEAEMDVDGMGMDRDLDEEVPDAIETGWGVGMVAGIDDNDDDDDDDEEDDEDNDDHYGLGNDDAEHDLDDDVPDAGSYQHTDTELEDESSIGDLSGLPSTSRMTVVQDMGFDRGASSSLADAWPMSSNAHRLYHPTRRSLNRSFVDDPQADSSVLQSSPIAARGRTRENARGGRAPN